MSYVQGTVVRLSARFTVPATGLPEEPSEVICKIEDPAEVVTIRRLSLGEVFADPDIEGRYFTDLATTMPGTWSYSFESTGPEKVVKRKDITVRSAL